jgi:hypothetical protein
MLGQHQWNVLNARDRCAKSAQRIFHSQVAHALNVPQASRQVWEELEKMKRSFSFSYTRHRIKIENNML